MAVRVKIVASHIVKAAEKTWTGTMELSEVDMIFVKSFIRQVYMYNNNDTNERKSATFITDTLKSSLAKVLVHFYPFTGRLRPTATGEGGRFELHVDDDDLASGVPFVEAEADADVADLGDDLMEADVQGRLTNLFCSDHDPNKALEELPLMKVQITHFRCGGVAVAFTLSHAIVDGTAAAHFLGEWARITRGEPLKLTPIHDRTLLRAGEPPRSILKFIKQEVSVYQPPLPDNNFVQHGVDQPPLPHTTLETLRVSKSQIDKLKQIVGHITNDRPYSRFELLTAHVWRCINKAKENKDKKLTALSVIMNFRNRINPPVPQEFGGNAVILNAVVSESEDLVSNPLAYACNNIRKSLEKVNNDTIWEYLDYLKYVKKLDEKIRPITPEGVLVDPDIIAVCWLNLSLNNLDFGWGNESYMASILVNRGAKVKIQNGYEDGSVIVTILLQLTLMDKFKYHFFHQLA